MELQICNKLQDLRHIFGFQQEMHPHVEKPSVLGTAQTKSTNLKLDHIVVFGQFIVMRLLAVFFQGGTCNASLGDLLSTFIY